MNSRDADNTDSRPAATSSSGIPGCFGLEGTPRTPSATRAGTIPTRPGMAPQPLGTHLLHRMGAVQTKRENSEAAARPQLVTVTKGALSPTSHWSGMCCCSRLPLSPQDPLRDTRAELQPAHRNASTPGNLLPFTFSPRYSLVFAAECLEVYLCLRGCIRHRM